MTAGLAIYDTVSCWKLVGGRGCGLMSRIDAGLNRGPNTHARASVLNHLGHSTSTRRFTPTALGKRVQWDHYYWPQVSAEEMKRARVG